MLQQTQVERVIPKYLEFISSFPTLRSLSETPDVEVLRRWQGLGYNRRALALKKCVSIILREYNGKLPSDPGMLVSLPGIGPATSAALAAFIYNKPAILIETNIRTAIIYYFFRRRRKVNDNEIRGVLACTLDHENPRHWYYALMDYGAMLKRKYRNLNTKSAHYLKQSPFKGSDRQFRGRILRALLESGPMTPLQLKRQLKADKIRFNNILKGLLKDKLISKSGSIITAGFD